MCIHNFTGSPEYTSHYNSNFVRVQKLYLYSNKHTNKKINMQKQTTIIKQQQREKEKKQRLKHWEELEKNPISKDL